MSALRRWLPAALLGAGLLAFFAFDLGRYLSFEALRDNRAALIAWVGAHGWRAGLAYCALYVVVVAFSLPGGAVMTLAGGFLFGVLAGTAWTVLGATVGATAVFLAARSALGDSLRRRAVPWLARFEAGFRADAIAYLFVLRLVPLFPFFVVNLVPAFLGVRLRDYVFTTFFGILPGTFVYASAGNGLGAVLAAGRRPDLALIFSPPVLLPLLGLAALALLPVLYRRWKARRAAGTRHGRGGES